MNLPTFRATALAMLLPTMAVAQVTPKSSPDTAVRVDVATPPAADGPAPYGGYTLFNPTPADKLRSFSTDRPNKGTSPITVDAGHLQIETDLFGVAYDGYNTSNTISRQFFTADPVIKLGLTDHWDIEINLGGYQDLRVKDRAARQTSRFSGYGDTVLKTKINLFGANGGDTALAVVPFVKLPTAGRGLGNDHVEGGVIGTYSYSLPWKITATVSPEIDVFQNGNNRGSHMAFTGSVNFSRPITETLTANVELWTQVQAAHTPTQYSLDLAVAYAIGDNSQIDAATYIGLNKATPDVVGYVGFAHRF